MTTATRTMDKGQNVASADQPDLSPSTLSRLLTYMIGGELRPKFILGTTSPYRGFAGPDRAALYHRPGHECDQ